MPRKVNPEERKAQYNAIKRTARDLMRENGTAGLSIRAIARALDMTAPALYYYFENMDALITALIVDGFNGIADAMEASQANHADEDPADQLMEIMLAYRQWAMTNRADFQLLYGNPIPKYHAPREITVPAVIRGFVVIITAIQAVLDSGEVNIPDYLLVLPTVVEQTYFGIITNTNETTQAQRDTIAEVSMEAMILGIQGWGQMHGLIMLELFEHLQPVVGDTEVYYRYQIKNMFRSMGLK
jgi:AcrR family transcriptional regulator